MQSRFLKSHKCMYYASFYNFGYYVLAVQRRTENFNKTCLYKLRRYVGAINTNFKTQYIDRK